MANINGTVISKANVDGVQRRYSVRRIIDTPLILTVNSSISDIYSTWEHRAFLQGAIFLLLSCTVIVCCVMLLRESNRRETLELALRQTAQKLSIAATTDSLTGLSTRRAFDEMIDREWRQAYREKRSLSILMIDIDHFKAYNDLYGHQQGDRALQTVATIIRREAARPRDFVGRYGGEEFEVVLPDASAIEAMVVAGRIRLALVDANLKHEGSPQERITVSIGIYEAFPNEMQSDIGSATRCADIALYWAKKNGRDQTCVYCPQMSYSVD